MKRMKMLFIALTVAASALVVGLTFAVWTATNTLSNSGKTATILTFTSSAVFDSNADGALVPKDQTNGIGTGMHTSISKTFVVQPGDAASWTVAISGYTDSLVGTGSVLQYSINDGKLNGSSWSDLKTATTIYSSAMAAAVGVTAVGTFTMNIQLVSSDVADMGQTFSFTLTLA